MDAHKKKSFPFRMTDENREKLEILMGREDSPKNKTVVMNEALKLYLNSKLRDDRAS